MKNKINKIIVFSAFFITLVIVVFLFETKQKGGFFLEAKPFTVKECENLLNTYNKNNKLPPQRVCKVINEKEIKEVYPTDIVKPSDVLIISVDLPKLMKAPLYNVLSHKPAQKPSDQTYVFCYVIYPMLKKEDMYSINEEDFDKFYINYKWKVYPFNSLNFKLKGNNFVCSKPLSLSQISVISLQYQIPEAIFLQKGRIYTRSYGLKILLVPDNIKYNLKNSSDVVQNATHFDTIFFYMKPLNLK